MIILFLTLFIITCGLLAWLLWPNIRAKQHRFCARISACVVVLAAALYLYVGAPRVIAPLSVHNAFVKKATDIKNVYLPIVAEKPNDLEARLFLGQAYFDLGAFTESAAQFKQAVLLSKGEPRIIMAYAEALIMQENGVVSAVSKKSIDIALMIDPKLPLARYYKAVWLLQEGKQEEAMAMMKALYAELPDDSSLKKRINAQIGR